MTDWRPWADAARDNRNDGELLEFPKHRARKTALYAEIVPSMSTPRLEADFDKWLDYGSFDKWSRVMMKTASDELEKRHKAEEGAPPGSALTAAMP
jgi:hypothetical protein